MAQAVGSLSDEINCRLEVASLPPIQEDALLRQPAAEAFTPQSSASDPPDEHVGLQYQADSAQDVLLASRMAFKRERQQVARARNAQQPRSKTSHSFRSIRADDKTPIESDVINRDTHDSSKRASCRQGHVRHVKASSLEHDIRPAADMLQLPPPAGTRCTPTLPNFALAEAAATSCIMNCVLTHTSAFGMGGVAMTADCGSADDDVEHAQPVLSGCGTSFATEVTPDDRVHMPTHALSLDPSTANSEPRQMQYSTPRSDRSTALPCRPCIGNMPGALSHGPALEPLDAPTERLGCAPAISLPVDSHGRKSPSSPDTIHESLILDDSFEDVTDISRVPQRQVRTAQPGIGTFPS
jgi:hypothetical protein